MLRRKATAEMNITGNAKPVCVASVKRSYQIAADYEQRK